MKRKQQHSINWFSAVLGENMSSDWVPFVSQIKSFVQLICGCDRRAAAETQYNFLTQCPIVSHLLGLAACIIVPHFSRIAIKGGTKTVYI